MSGKVAFVARGIKMSFWVRKKANCRFFEKAKATRKLDEQDFVP